MLQLTPTIRNTAFTLLWKEGDGLVLQTKEQQQRAVQQNLTSLTVAEWYRKIARPKMLLKLAGIPRQFFYFQKHKMATFLTIVHFVSFLGFVKI
jgi:hypothetical protein